MTQSTGKTAKNRVDDPTVTGISYYTDRGAFYYYNNASQPDGECYDLDCNMQKTMEWVVGNWTIPYTSVQYDSWRYLKNAASATMDGDIGLRNWTARPDVLDNGGEDLYKLHNLPVAAHNRIWAAQNVYRMTEDPNKPGTYKEGPYYNDFVCNDKNPSEVNLTNYCFPVTDNFWNDFFKNENYWGLKLYEQDWMCDSYWNTAQLKKDVLLGDRWLSAMNSGAKKNSVFIQYCMSLPRIMMASINHDMVSQIRVSEDYLPGFTVNYDVDNTGQWDIGYTGLVAWALNLSPSKDTFWSTKYQDGQTLYNSDTIEDSDGTPPHEPWPLRQLMMSLYSTGLVAPSDKIGHENTKMLKMAIRKDGILLKPDVPISLTDYDMANFGLGWPRKSQQVAENKANCGSVLRTWSTIQIEDAISNEKSPKKLEIPYGIILTMNQTCDFTAENIGRFIPGYPQIDISNNAAFQGPLDFRTFMVENTTDHQITGVISNYFDQNPLESKIILPTHTRSGLLENSASTMRLYSVSPQFFLKDAYQRRTVFSLIGEKDKLTPMSNNRVKKVVVKSNSLEIEITGVPSEKVTFVGYKSVFLLEANTMINDKGEGVIVFDGLFEPEDPENIVTTDVPTGSFKISQISLGLLLLFFTIFHQ